MWKPIRLKNEYILIAVTAIVLLISYQLAFKKTIEALHIHQQLNKQIAAVSDLSYQPAYLERKNANLAKIIGLYKADTVTFRSNVISIIATIAEKQHVKLSEVPLQDPLFHTNKFIVERLDFEGDFFSLTSVLNQLQSTNGIGVIRSVSYKLTAIRSNSKENRKTMMNIYLELAR